MARNPSIDVDRFKWFENFANRLPLLFDHNCEEINRQTLDNA